MVFEMSVPAQEKDRSNRMAIDANGICHLSCRLDPSFGKNCALNMGSTTTGYSRMLGIPQSMIGKMSFSIKQTTNGTFLVHVCLIWSLE